MKTAEQFLDDYVKRTSIHPFTLEGINAEDVIELMGKYADQFRPDVIKSVCDHIDEKSGMICTGGRCRKCNEIV